MELLEAHIRALQRLRDVFPDGIVASELVSDREAREYVLTLFTKKGYIQRRRRFRGERIYITEKGLNFLEDYEKRLMEIEDKDGGRKA